MVDMRNGERRLGEDCHNSVLKVRDVQQIRRLAASGMSSFDVANEMSIPRNTVFDSGCGRAWSQVTDPPPVTWKNNAGENNHNAKLTSAKVKIARIRHGSGETISSIARSMGVARQTMTKAIKRTNWRRVK